MGEDRPNGKALMRLDFTNERRLFIDLTPEGAALKDQALNVPCEMEGCMNLTQDEQRKLKELLDKAIVKIEV